MEDQRRRSRIRPKGGFADNLELVAKANQRSLRRRATAVLPKVVLDYAEGRFGLMKKVVSTTGLERSGRESRPLSIMLMGKANPFISNSMFVLRRGGILPRKKNARSIKYKDAEGFGVLRA